MSSCGEVPQKKTKGKVPKPKPMAPTDDHHYNGMRVDEIIQDLIGRGAIFVVNHSAGKDSQLMQIHLERLVPKEQLVVVHSDLGEVEWDGVKQHISNTVTPGIPIIITRNPNKTFIDMVHHRQKFPDAQNRQCTSDLKRGPIETAIRRLLKSLGKHLVVNCMGLRAEESDNRKNLQVFSYHERNSKAGREWYDWLPIHKVPTAEVIPMIHAAGQKVHWAYYKGMSRLSCKFCILANQADLTTSATLNRDHYNFICSLEEHYNFSLQMSGKRLPEITGIPFTRVSVIPRTPEEAKLAIQAMSHASLVRATAA
jgi:DNA sulfur modification protein DndC